MKGLLTVCSIAALCCLSAGAQAQTAAMSSPMNSSQSSMAQPQTGGQMSSGQMAGENTKKHKKPRAPNAMAAGNTNGSTTAGTMGSQPASNSNAMPSPH